MVPAFHVFSDVAENLAPIRRAIKSLDVLPHIYQTTEAQTLQTFLLGVKSEGSCSS